MLPRVILVPTDFSSTAETALDRAVELAEKLDARIYLLHVVGAQVMGAEYGLAVTSSMVEGIMSESEAAMARLLKPRANRAPFAPPIIKVGEPRSTITTTASDVGADLIIMGTHGRRGMSRIVLGSIAETVARTSPCPVMLVRSDK